MLTMKRQATLALILGGLFLFSHPADAASDISVSLRAQETVLTYSPLLVNARTLVAGEDLARLVNGKVSHDREMVTLTVGQTTFTFKLNGNAVRTDRWQYIDQGAVLRGRTVYLPLRWVCEQLGLQVKWEPAFRKVVIAMNEARDEFVLLDASKLSSEEKAFVNQARKTKGIHKLGNLYVIARGAVPNPGHGIKLVKQERNWEQLKVYVQLTTPEPGMMYAQVISYPYLVGRVDLPPYTTIQFVDVKTGKRLFE
jgi:hypothetical protein